MSPLPHRIRRLSLQVRATSPPEALALRRELRDRIDATLLAAIERAFDAAGAHGHVVHVPRLVVQARIAGGGDVVGELARSIEHELRAQLASFRAAGPITGADGPDAPPWTRRALLVHYLRTGALPWPLANTGNAALAELREAAADLDGVLGDLVPEPASLGARVAGWFRWLQLVPEGRWPIVARTAGGARLAEIVALIAGEASASISRYARLQLAAAAITAARQELDRAAATELAALVRHALGGGGAEPAGGALRGAGADPGDPGAADGEAVSIPGGVDAAGSRVVAPGALHHLIARLPEPAASTFRMWIGSPDRDAESTELGPGATVRSADEHHDLAAMPAGPGPRGVAPHEPAAADAAPVQAPRATDTDERGPSSRPPAATDAEAPRPPSRLPADDPWPPSRPPAAATGADVTGPSRRDLASDANDERLRPGTRDDASSVDAVGQAARPASFPMAAERTAGPVASDLGAEGPTGHAARSAGSVASAEPAARSTTSDTDAERATRPAARPTASGAAAEPARLAAFRADASAVGAAPRRSAARRGDVAERTPGPPELRPDRPPLTAPDIHAPPAWAAASRTLPFGDMVHHAGLVLLHPFLSRFFEATAVKPAGDSALPASELPRAAALLHLLATGAPEPLEAELDFIKILLGLPRDAPLLVSDGLVRPADREEVDGLLAAVISHWQVLKRTSVTALRTSFLQRPGLVRHDGHGIRLQVEPAPYDLLLGQLPWGIATVKLPWMTQLLFTDWPAP